MALAGIATATVRVDDCASNSHLRLRGSLESTMAVTPRTMLKRVTEWELRAEPLYEEICQCFPVRYGGYDNNYTRFENKHSLFTCDDMPHFGSVANYCN